MIRYSRIWSFSWAGEGGGARCARSLSDLTSLINIHLMNSDRYSTYEAKARFSELLRKVREGRTVTITYHGDPVAEIRPLTREEDLDSRKASLAARGLLVRGSGLRGKLRPLARRPGALQRFLEDRGD
jgi:prevent-host-death family protein